MRSVQVAPDTAPAFVENQLGIQDSSRGSVRTTKEEADVASLSKEAKKENSFSWYVDFLLVNIPRLGRVKKVAAY